MDCKLTVLAWNFSDSFVFELWPYVYDMGVTELYTLTESCFGKSSYTLSDNFVG